MYLKCQGESVHHYTDRLLSECYIILLLSLTNICKSILMLQFFNVELILDILNTTLCKIQIEKVTISVK